MVPKVRTSLRPGTMTQATTVFLCTSRPAQRGCTTSMTPTSIRSKAVGGPLLFRNLTRALSVSPRQHSVMPCSPPAQLNSRARGIKQPRAGSPPRRFSCSRGAPRGMALNRQGWRRRPASVAFRLAVVRVVCLVLLSLLSLVGCSSPALSSSPFVEGSSEARVGQVRLWQDGAIFILVGDLLGNAHRRVMVEMYELGRAE